jgi:hypothetical protein
MYFFSVRRADVIRQKSEAVRHLASQLIEEHEDYARYKTADQIKQGHKKVKEHLASVRGNRVDSASCSGKTRTVSKTGISYCHLS